MNYYKIKWGKPFKDSNGDLMCRYSYSKVKSLGESNRLKAVSVDRFVIMSYVRVLDSKSNSKLFPRYFKSEQWGEVLDEEVNTKSEKYLQHLIELSKEVIEKRGEVSV